ncbi:hypothetical protein U5921_01950 [Sinanaerobacter sp. ZZT-01]|nr:hypothetical protein [Sinanaerobacter sp. ZZT-01]WRR95149.1 hypothetical protein U5921_01950 [Sinanaerobacter sp. ZZT-01]
MPWTPGLRDGGHYPRPHGKEAERQAVQRAGRTQLYLDNAGSARHSAVLLRGLERWSAYQRGQKRRLHDGVSRRWHQSVLSQQPPEQGACRSPVFPNPDDGWEHGRSPMLSYPQADAERVLEVTSL